MKIYMDHVAANGCALSAALTRTATVIGDPSAFRLPVPSQKDQGAHPPRGTEALH